jgi:hypothetical protein
MNAKYKNMIKGKMVSSIRPFFTSIQGFDHLTLKMSPMIPVFTKVVPLKNIKFELAVK